MEQKKRIKSKKKKRQKKQERVLLALCILAVVMILMIVLRSVLGKKEDPSVTSEGVKIIQKEENADVEEIEKEIERLTEVTSP